MRCVSIWQERSRHLANPGEFTQACRSLSADHKGQFVFVDEAQSVPSIFDAVQTLYDADKTRWRFVLCGSSARKLRLTGANLLPGRSLVHHLYPLTLAEHPADEGRIAHATSPLPMPWSKGKSAKHPFPKWDLLTLREKRQYAKHGYVICRCPRPLQLHAQITALPWFCL